MYGKMNKNGTISIYMDKFMEFQRFASFGFFEAYCLTLVSMNLRVKKFEVNNNKDVNPIVIKKLLPNHLICAKSNNDDNFCLNVRPQQTNKIYSLSQAHSSTELILLGDFNVNNKSCLHGYASEFLLSFRSRTISEPT